MSSLQTTHSFSKGISLPLLLRRWFSKGLEKWRLKWNPGIINSSSCETDSKPQPFWWNLLFETLHGMGTVCSDSQSCHASFVTWMRNSCSEGWTSLSRVLQVKGSPLSPKLSSQFHIPSAFAALLMLRLPLASNDFPCRLWLSQLTCPPLCQKPPGEPLVLGSEIAELPYFPVHTISGRSRRGCQVLSTGLTFSSSLGDARAEAATPPTSTWHSTHELLHIPKWFSLVYGHLPWSLLECFGFCLKTLQWWEMAWREDPGCVFCLFFLHALSTEATLRRKA